MYQFKLTNKMWLNGKNPLPLTIQSDAAPDNFNAYIPWGSKKGLHIFISPSEKIWSFNIREYDLAWLDFADYSHDFSYWMDEMEWHEGYWFKYGKVNNK
jgi:hypothetical protein